MGQTLTKRKITDNQTSIVMSNFVSGIYFVKVIQGYKELKTFKIIKKLKGELIMKKLFYNFSSPVLLTATV